MINYAKDQIPAYKTNMRGGAGTVALAPLFEEKIPHLRLLSVITMEPGCSIGNHEHIDEAEVYYVLEGEATVIDDGVSYTLKPGDAHLCASGHAHTLLNNAATTMRLLAIIPTVAE